MQCDISLRVFAFIHQNIIHLQCKHTQKRFHMYYIYIFQTHIIDLERLYTSLYINFGLWACIIPTFPTVVGLHVCVWNFSSVLQCITQFIGDWSSVMRLYTWRLHIKLIRKNASINNIIHFEKYIYTSNWMIVDSVMSLMIARHHFNNIVPRLHTQFLSINPQLRIINNELVELVLWLSFLN